MWIIKFTGSTPLRRPSAVNLAENSYTLYALSVSLISQHLVCRISQTQMYRLTYSIVFVLIKWFLQFLQRVSIACYAERCTNYSKSVRPSVRASVRLSVCHMLALCQNDSGYDHAVFTVGQPHDSSFLFVNFNAKFQRELRERGRRMRGLGKIGNF